MKKIILLFLVSSLCAMAQDIADVIETNCDASAKDTLYKWLSQNKVVLIAADGFDCSVCQSHAPAIKNFANDNPNIRVWGAMNFKYSSTTPTCTQINNWKSSYSWDNVFMFVDTDRSWAAVGYPTYTVINPLTKKVEKFGSNNYTINDATARERALNINKTLQTEDAVNTLAELNVYYQHNQLIINNANSISGKLQVLGINGQLNFEGVVNASNLRIPLQLNNGVYIVVIGNQKLKLVVND